MSQLKASAVSPNPPLPPPALAPLLPDQVTPGPPTFSALGADRNQLEALDGFLGQPDDRAQVRTPKIKVSRARELVDAVWKLSNFVGLTAVVVFPDYEGVVGEVSDIVRGVFVQVAVSTGDVVDFLRACLLTKPKPASKEVSAPSLSPLTRDFSEVLRSQAERRPRRLKD